MSAGGDEELARRVLNADQGNPKAVLLLPHTATAEQINAAWKRLCLKLHPDKSGSKLAHEAFIRAR